MDPQALPEHVAVILDGNGRWAKARLLPRIFGHREGAVRVEKLVEHAARSSVKYLSLFAFSSENRNRPSAEVCAIFSLFEEMLENQKRPLVDSRVRLRVAGDASIFPESLRAKIREVEDMTEAGSRMVLTICANYGGRWDILEGARKLAGQGLEATEENLRRALAFNWAPDVDLMIRTGGERRISNFILWQAAYAELYFTETLWPDFSESDFDAALAWYSGRQRRFGLTSEQVERP